jgi:glycosyltransferase involved in cell wall biosynthesis
MGGMSLSLIEQGRRAGLPAACVVVDDWLLYGSTVDARTRLARRTGPLAPALERLARVPARLELEEAGTWLFASETLRRRAESRGLRLPDVRVAYPGIDHGLFRDPRPPREDWAWRLLYCGRIDERKGIDLAVEERLLEAVSRRRQRAES